MYLILILQMYRREKYHVLFAILYVFFPDGYESIQIESTSIYFIEDKIYHIIQLIRIRLYTIFIHEYEYSSFSLVRSHRGFEVFELSRVSILNKNGATFHSNLEHSKFG